MTSHSGNSRSRMMISVPSNTQIYKDYREKFKHNHESIVANYLKQVSKCLSMTLKGAGR